MSSMPPCDRAVREASASSTAGMPVIRLFEAIGQCVSALGLPDGRQWQAASTLLHYILGVSAQNAAISVFAKQLKLDRQTSLEEAASVWAALDPRDFPFSAAIAGRLATHDDRQDFVDGVDLILAGLRATGGTAR